MRCMCVLSAWKHRSTIFGPQAKIVDHFQDSATERRVSENTLSIGSAAPDYGCFLAGNALKCASAARKCLILQCFHV